MNQRFRDVTYLVLFLLIASALLYLGSDLLRQSIVLPWVVTFAATTAISILLLSLYRFKVQLEESRNELMRTEAELDFARQVQQALFPKTMPTGGYLEFSGICLPARGISGDYYDVHQLEDGRMIIAIADISGKGISAAILMANLQALVRAVAHSGQAPAEVCRRLNHHLVEVSEASRFATLFYGEWLAAERRLRYVNAGHNPPMLISSESCHRLDSGGMPLGIFAEAAFEMGEAVLTAGDLLVLYSDGVTEAGLKHGRELGEDRLRSLVQAHRLKPLAEIQKIVLAEVRQRTGDEPDDDITLLMVRATQLPA
ncbi:MAG: PP2C family protein-serine/threonine phosphatase [Acidobacteria bacterium]|nr:PP2C family protein-serine/threonine phosphatase [Acidobacteriota bacterium]